ncbi:MAG TPA: hypothetical protein VFO93_12560 [Hymenobacter sp.]|uniref:hypothetical protein n=1 Tax=Hymenobacter sp. TaxID=1898978 RepID=UPI002D7F8D13|nr:hypothetical protein [Hymenobacter sp.]HET9504366.1 hypothetical protein [Hymenobacter sp.]
MFPFHYTRFTFLLPCLALASCLTACQDKKDAPEAAQCAGTSASAAGRVVVRYQEQLGSTGPAATLLCNDEVIHPCANYTLEQVVATTGSQLSINFTGVTTPTLCLTHPRLAYTQVDLSKLPLGTYNVTWQAGGRQTTGSIAILTDRVEVSSCDSNTVAVRNPITYRIPATTVWGQSYARTPAAQAAVAVVLDSLRKEGAVPITLPAGRYSYFQVDATGKLVPISASQNGQPASAIVTPVLLSYSGNFARIKGILKRKPQAADLSFGLNSARGENAW